MNTMQIRKRAVELLDSNNLFSAPVSLDDLAKKLGIRVKHEDLEDEVSGFLVAKEGRSTVVLNKNHHHNRRRFTLAHEIGHFVLHKELDEVFLDANLTYFRSKDYPGADSRIEREANCFAAELLMPKRIIAKLIEKKNMDISDESDFLSLAKAFKVSERALAIRLMKLGYLDN